MDVFPLPEAPMRRTCNIALIYWETSQGKACLLAFLFIVAAMIGVVVKNATDGGHTNYENIF